MSGTDDYRAQLEARIADMTNERDNNQMLYDKSIGGDILDRPSDDYIKASIGEPDLRTDDDIGMEAWTQVQQEQGDVYATYLETQEKQQIDDQAIADEKEKRDMDQQRERDLADQKVRDEEIKKGKQRESAVQESLDVDAKELQQAAQANEAQREKDQAAVNLAEQERTATQETEVSSYRDQFRQAAERNQSIDRDIE